MFTANTMSSAIEALGMALPGSASGLAVTANNHLNPKKIDEVRRSVKSLFMLMKNDLKAKDIMTKKAFENAITVLFALGGSTNGILHLLALAKEADVELDIEEFNRIGEKVPLVANLRPHGQFHMKDLDEIGGLPVIMKDLLDHGLLYGDCMTVTGKTIAENLELINLQQIHDADTKKVACPLSNPFAPPGRHISILKGTLAPQSAVLKLSGKHLTAPFQGHAIVFNGEDAALDAILKGEVWRKIQNFLMKKTTFPY